MNAGTWTLELITPQTAETYLSAMGRNRPPKAKRIEKYADDMKHDRWRLTHQGIAFNCDGSLKDGQHRLCAILKAGVSVPMWVYRGLPNDAMRIIDTHGVRTDQNALWIDGLEIDNKGTAVAKVVYQGTKGKRLQDRDEMHEFVMRHHEALAFARKHLATGVRGIGHSVVAAVVARAWYTVDRERLSEFCGILKEGVTDDKRNYAALRVRTWLLQNSATASGGGGRAVMYRKVQAGLRAFFDGRDISKLYEASEELFPLPEETDPDGHVQ